MFDQTLGPNAPWSSDVPDLYCAIFRAWQRVVSDTKGEKQRGGLTSEHPLSVLLKAHRSNVACVSIECSLVVQIGTEHNTTYKREFLTYSSGNV